MSQATTAISARIHNIKFGTFGYSNLQCSAKCFPEDEKPNFTEQAQMILEVDQTQEIIIKQ